MSRIESLNYLKQKVIKNEYISGLYKEDENSYCSIGHLLNYNKFDFNLLSKKQNMLEICSNEMDFLADYLSDFTPQELYLLQDYNDMHSQKELLDYIESLIKNEPISIYDTYNIHTQNQFEIY